MPSDPSNCYYMCIRGMRLAWPKHLSRPVLKGSGTMGPVCTGFRDRVDELLVQGLGGVPGPASTKRVEEGRTEES